MADEKKTYLINIESNLAKYAEEADKAAVKVAELKVANDNLKNSVGLTPTKTLTLCLSIPIDLPPHYRIIRM